MKLRSNILSVMLLFIMMPYVDAQTVIRFAVIGDYGYAGQPEADVSNLVKSWNPDFIITLGDNNYDNGAASTIDINIGQYYHEFISPYTGSYGSGDTVNRFFPCLGNHDWVTTGATPYLDYFTLPGNERYYDFVKGPVHFYAIDSDSHEPDGNSSSSAQAVWLQTALASSPELWKIVYMHHAPYSSSSNHGSQPVMQWPYKQWGATTVMAGHDHTYERIYTGNLLYFVNGLGGKSLYAFGSPISGSLARYNANYGAMLVEASNDSINFKFINRAGTLIDNYTVFPSDVLPPAQVQLLQPADGNSFTTLPALCTWQKTSTATAYHFELSALADFSSTLISDTTLTDTIRNVAGLSINSTYYWRLRAKNANGWGAFSESFAFTTWDIPEQVITDYPPDNSVGLPNPVVCKWLATAHADAYQIDVALDSIFTSLVQSDSSIVDTTYTPSGLDSLTQYFWRVRAKNGAGWGEYSDTRNFKLSGAVIISANINKGWNLISLPVAAGNLPLLTVFPNAVSQAWRWNGGYISEDTLATSIGYWLKFDSTRTITLTGTPRDNDTIDVVAGWNLIGSISNVVSADSIFSIPISIKASSFFEYQGDYQKTDTLLPFRGYWIKIQSAGKLILK